MAGYHFGIGNIKDFSIPLLLGKKQSFLYPLPISAFEGGGLVQQPSRVSDYPAPCNKHVPFLLTRRLNTVRTARILTQIWNFDFKEKYRSLDIIEKAKMSIIIDIFRPDISIFCRLH